MCKPDIPSWYYNNKMLLNSNAQSINRPNPQQQQQQQQLALMSPGSSRQPNYSNMPQFQQPHINYYAPRDNFALNSLSAFNSVQAQAQAQSVAQTRCQDLGQQQAWFDLQLQQNHNNWNQHLTGRTCDTGALQRGDLSGFCQVHPAINVPDNASQSGRSQRSHFTYISRNAFGCCQQEYECYPPLDGGTLNRIDSVSSFRNQRGSRVRSSEHDIIAYRRIVARKLKSEARQETAVAMRMRKHQLIEEERVRHSRPVMELQPEQIRPSQPGCQNVVMEQPLEARGSSFIRKLVLRMRKDHKIKSNKSQSSNTECSPNNSQEDIKCYLRKKSNFFKRLFGGL